MRQLLEPLKGARRVVQLELEILEGLNLSIVWWDLVETLVLSDALLFAIRAVVALRNKRGKGVGGRAKHKHARLEA